MISGAAVAVRAVVALAGVALLVLPGAWHPIPIVITAVGVAAAVVAPRVVGSSLATIGFVVAWIAAEGWAGNLPVARTVAAAAALYVLQVAAALAAAVPLDATVSRATLVRWAYGSGLPVAVAAVVIALDEALPRRSGTPWLELAGTVGVLLVGAAGVYTLRRPAAAKGSTVWPARDRSADGPPS